MTTYNNSDEGIWHSFDEKPITTDIFIRGKLSKVIERHNPNKWNITAVIPIDGDNHGMIIGYHLQKDFPFVIFSVNQPGKSWKRSDREYHYVPEKYQDLKQIFDRIIAERIMQNPDFVCGEITYKNPVLPAYINPTIIPVVMLA